MKNKKIDEHFAMMFIRLAILVIMLIICIINTIFWENKTVKDVLWTVNLMVVIENAIATIIFNHNINVDIRKRKEELLKMLEDGE